MGVSGVGVGQMGVSGVGIAPIASSTVSMGTTTIAPTIYEKAIVQDIPTESRVEYIPYQKSHI